nr:hypothetical protein [Tanacetum cinerariifolium]
MTGNLKLLINFVWKFMGTVRFENDHVAAILGFGELQWGNILITRVCFVKGLGHNLFSVGQFCDSDLEVAFRRNACFVRNLEGVDLLKGDRSTNLYTINLHEMASASPICLMARASSTKSWLWHQRLSHLNFDTINDLARNDHVAVPNSRQRLHLLHMDLCGPMRIASINGKWYVLVIVDDYSRYKWVHFLRSKDEAPEVIIKFLKRITNGVVERRNRTLVEAARTMLIFSRAPLFLWAEAIATAVYNRRTKKIMETMNVSFDELSAMDFEQRSLKPGLNSMTSGHITTVRTIPSTQEPQVHQSSTASATIVDTAPIPTNSSSLATNIPISSQDVDKLNLNAIFDGNTFFNPFANSSTSVAASSSHQNVDPSNMHTKHYETKECQRGYDRSSMDRFNNKHDEEQTVIRNKSRFVVRGYRQEEGIDFEESFAPKKKMVKTNSTSENEACCSKDCKKNTETLNNKITDLADKLFDAKNMIYHYKLGLAQVKFRLVEYKERKVKYCEKIRTLEFRTESNNECIEILKKKLETLKQEKDGVDGKLAGLLTASKDLDNLIESQRPAPTIESSPDDAQNRNPSVTKTEASPSTISPKSFIKLVKPADSPTVVKIENKVKTAKKPSIKYAEQYRKTNKKPNVRGNQRNWNNLKSHQLGLDYVMKKKACFKCGDFNHLAYDCKKGVKREHLDIKMILIRVSHPDLRVQRLEKELKVRTLIHKVDRGRSRPVMAWVPKKRVQRLERELKARAPIHKEDRGRSRNLIADAASSLGDDCWDLRAFNSRNLIADAASSLGEDCWELNV